MVLKATLMLSVFSVILSAHGQGLDDTHMKSLGNNCAVCHQETPPALAPNEATCIKCHGDLTKLGSKPLPKGAVNPHMNHVEELYCADCHHIHKPSENYCLQCHDEASMGMKVP